MDIYADNILDHFRHPRHHGELQDFDICHEEKNVECGDVVKVWLRISPSTSSGRSRLIAEIGWTGTGCAISQASMSILCEEVGGRNVGEVENLRKDDVYALLGVPIGPRRFKCALMGLHAVKNALRKAGGLTLQDWVATVSLGEN